MTDQKDPLKVDQGPPPKAATVPPPPPPTSHSDDKKEKHTPSPGASSITLPLVPPDELDPDTLESFEAFVERDVSMIAQQFKNTYVDLRKTTARPNVLVAGTTGAGKSSLINSVFGRPLALEGAGEPITTHFTRYAPEDSDVVIYDSRGLEHGNTDAFIETTRTFFESLRQGGAVAGAIHVVWYVINGAGSRIQPFEEEICKTLFANLPIIFLINKADISSDDDRAILRKTLTALNLPGCAGIFDTVSGNHTPLLNVTKCPKCGSDDIIIRKKKGIATCEQCQSTISLLLTKDDIIAKTLETLPAVAREAFIAAQTFSCMHKDARAKIIMKEYHQECTSIRLAKTLLRGIARMLVRLAILWDFRDHGKTLGAEIAQDLLRRELSFRDKLLFFLRKCKGERDRTTAMGVLWNRCLRRIFITIFFTCAADERPDERGYAATDWHDLVQASFQDLNDTELTAMEELIHKQGLDVALEREMPTDRRDPLVPPQLSSPGTTPAIRRDLSPTPLLPPAPQVSEEGAPPPTSDTAPKQPPGTPRTIPVEAPDSSPKLTRPQVTRLATAAAAAAAAGQHHDGQEDHPQAGTTTTTAAAAAAATLTTTLGSSGSLSARERKKDRGLRLDADDLADIEKAAIMESKLNALDEEHAKRRSMSSSMSSLVTIVEDAKLGPVSGHSSPITSDSARACSVPPTVSIPIPVPVSGPVIRVIEQVHSPLLKQNTTIPATPSLVLSGGTVAGAATIFSSSLPSPGGTLKSSSDSIRMTPVGASIGSMMPVQPVPVMRPPASAPIAIPIPPAPAPKLQPGASSALSRSPRYTTEEGAAGVVLTPGTISPSAFQHVQIDPSKL